MVVTMYVCAVCTKSKCKIVDYWACSAQRCRFSCTDQNRSNVRCKTILGNVFLCCAHSQRTSTTVCLRSWLSNRGKIQIHISGKQKQSKKCTFLNLLLDEVNIFSSSLKWATFNKYCKIGEKKEEKIVVRLLFVFEFFIL